MKLYESKHFVITVPMNEYFSPDKRCQSLLLPAGLSAKMLFNAKGRYNDKSNNVELPHTQVFCSRLCVLCEYK